MLQTKYICQFVFLPYDSPNFLDSQFPMPKPVDWPSPHLPRYVSAKSTSLNSAGLPARMRCKVAKDFFLKTVMVGWFPLRMFHLCFLLFFPVVTELILGFLKVW